MTRLSLDKKTCNLQLLSLRHPKTFDEKALEKQSPSNFLLTAKASFMKRSKKVENVRAEVDHEERERRQKVLNQKMETPRPEEGEEGSAGLERGKREVEGKSASQLQKKLKRQKKTKILKDSCNEQKRKLKDFFSKSFKKPKQANLSKLLEKESHEESLKAPEKNEESLGKVSARHEKSLSNDLREKYLSSCNLVSTNRLDFFENESPKRESRRKESSEEKGFSCLGFKTYQANEVGKKKKDFLRDKENIENKIAKIDEKLEQIDKKLMFMQQKSKKRAKKGKLVRNSKKVEKGNCWQKKGKQKGKLVKNFGRSLKLSKAKPPSIKGASKTSKFSKSIHFAPKNKFRYEVSSHTNKHFINL